MTVMLYKHPGPHKIHGSTFDHVVVEEICVDDCIDEGWRLTTTEALDLVSEPKKRNRRTKAEMQEVK